MAIQFFVLTHMDRVVVPPRDDVIAVDSRLRENDGTDWIASLRSQ